MNADLVDRLDRLAMRDQRHGADALLAAVEEVFADEMGPRVVTTGRGGRIRGPWLAAAAAAAVLLVGVIGFYLGGSTSPPPQVVPPVATVVTADTPTTLEAPPPVTTFSGGDAVSFVTLDWRRISSPALGGAGDEWMETVTLGGPGLVAAGAECPGSVCTLFGAEDGWDAAVWVSSDGVGWIRVLDESGALGGPGDQIILDVAAAGPGLVAVGLEDPSNFGGMRPTDSYWNRAAIPNDEDDVDGAIWVSPNGESWSRVVDVDGAFTGPGDQSIEAVVKGADRIVAVGSADGTAAVWISEDGLTWRRVRNVPAVIGAVSSRIHDVVSTDTGFVAVGTEDLEVSADHYAARGAVWTSPDGLDWSRVEHDPDIFGGTTGRADVAGNLGMWAVAKTDSGVVASGFGWPSLLPLWISADGHEWTRLGDSNPPFAWDSKGFPNTWTISHRPILALAAVGGQVLAVGWDIASADVIWPDSRRFFTKDLFWLGNVMPGTSMNDVAVFGGTAIAVGIDGLGDIWGPSDAAVWMAEISD